MWVLSEWQVRSQEYPWIMKFADDIVICKLEPDEMEVCSEGQSQQENYMSE